MFHSVKFFQLDSALLLEKQREAKLIKDLDKQCITAISQ